MGVILLGLVWRVICNGLFCLVAGAAAYELLFFGNYVGVCFLYYLHIGFG